MLAGGALLVIATFVPFAILRMIPAVEAGAVGHLEGLRQRGTGAMTRVARTAAQHALGEGLQALGSARLLAAADGASGGGTSDEDRRRSVIDSASQQADGRWEDESPRIFEEVLSGQRPAPPPPPKGPKPIIGWKPEDEEGGEGGGGGSGGPDGSGGEGGASSDQTPAAPSRATPRTGIRAPGPTGPEDAWMWEGVPAGEYLMGTPVPGKGAGTWGTTNTASRSDALPPAWPPGQRPEEGA